MTEVKIIVDYAIDEETNEIIIPLTTDNAKDISEAEELYFLIEMEKTVDTTSAGTVTFGIHNSSGYYVINLLNNASNVSPTSVYNNRASFMCCKNHASDNLYFCFKSYPNGQYNSKNEFYTLINAISGTEKDGILSCRSTTSTAFGVGTRIRLAIR